MYDKNYYDGYYARNRLHLLKRRRELYYKKKAEGAVSEPCTLTLTCELCGCLRKYKTQRYYDVAIKNNTRLCVSCAIENRRPRRVKVIPVEPPPPTDWFELIKYNIRHGKGTHTLPVEVQDKFWSEMNLRIRQKLKDEGLTDRCMDDNSLSYLDSNNSLF